MTTLKRTMSLCLLLLAMACNNEPAQREPVVEQKPVVDTLPASLPKSSVNNYAPVDVSPMDMSYYPVEYPKLKMENPDIAPPLARVIYSRPHLQHRHFNDILKTDQPWRLGANESTEIQFFRAATIQGKKVNPGRYILYCIPHTDKWTIVLNSNIDTWGLKQVKGRDVQKFEVPVNRNQVSLEYFTMVFERTPKGADLVMAWDDVVTRLAITF